MTHAPADGGGSQGPGPTAESVLLEWIARRARGDHEDLDALCGAHLDLAAELRSLHGIWLEFEAMSKRFGLTGSLSERLGSLYGSKVDPRVELEPEDDRGGSGTPSDSDFTARVLGRLSERTPSSTRYRLKGQVAEGGMGAILRVWDEDLRRHLAMKVVLGQRNVASKDTPAVDKNQLARFLEEAQVTGQLDHPGIVPVHELGLDAAGRAYFTMKLVKGRDLKAVFDLVRDGKEDWSQVRALGVLLKVCEAMSYAHDKGVIHRDLKPANIMVGRYGEVYVMDWGLAKILGRADTRDLQPRPDAAAEGPTVIRSDRREAASETPDAPGRTQQGDVIGTPAYMPPEQARGDLDAMGPHSDVYAVGAMLYHLLCGHMPYVRRESLADNDMVWSWLIDGPPAPLAREAPAAPAELIAIAERAMARDSGNRYPDMKALARDLAAFLEGRVVAAYETGAWAQAKKWVRRNRALAGSLAAAALILVVGTATSLIYAGEAKQQAGRADAQAADVLSLSAQKALDELVAEAESLWPPHPGLLSRYERWLAEARALYEGSPPDPARGMAGAPSAAQHRAKLKEVVARSTLTTEEDLWQAARAHVDWETYEELRRAALVNPGSQANEVVDLEFALGLRSFTSASDAWWHRQLRQLVLGIEGLFDPDRGLAGDTISLPFGWGIEKRFRFAQHIARDSVEGSEARLAWSQAQQGISASPHYDGLKLAPQMGLLPLGADPDSGLWEFAHLQSGRPPSRGARGKLVLTEESGLVLVLIPGGTFTMGAQGDDPEGSNYDPDARPVEEPTHDVELSHYFLSKYTMNQAQWLRLTGRNPSTFQPGPGMEIIRSLLHPVEQVSWLDCRLWLTKLGLDLPSEAQWERAARGGTTTPWWTGQSRESVDNAANIADARAARGGVDWASIWSDFDDGYMLHCPVDEFRANPFGLHGVIGNVWEWCLDGFDVYPQLERRGPDPVVPWEDNPLRVRRGGSFNSSIHECRSAYRQHFNATYNHNVLGVRPARRLE